MLGGRHRPYRRLPCLFPDFYPAQGERLQHPAGDHPAGRGDGGALHTKAGGYRLQADEGYHRGSGDCILRGLPSTGPGAGLRLSMAQAVSWD